MDTSLRTEINQLIAKLPEDRLPSILTYLKEIAKLNQGSKQTGSLVEKILMEDANLLKRLAQ